MAMTLLALSLALAAQQQVPNMVVTPAQFTAALGTCRDQLARPAFAGEELESAGWPRVASQEATGSTPSTRMYRHPDNMLLLMLFDFPTSPDECIVTVPLRYQLNPANMTAAVSEFAGVKAKRGASPSWSTDWADLRLETQGDISARVIFTRKDR